MSHAYDPESKVFHGALPDCVRPHGSCPLSQAGKVLREQRRTLPNRASFPALMGVCTSDR